VFGVHRSSYKYWQNRPEKPDGRRAVLRSQVLELPPNESENRYWKNFKVVASFC